MEAIKQAIAAAVKELFNIEIEPELTRPDEQFGDYATNVALQLAGKLDKNPREIATALVEKISSADIAKIDIAGPGFINVYLTDQTFIDMLHRGPGQPYKNKVIVAEYSDPNPFKVLHAGHLYTSVVGDAIANLLESAGGEVHRVNFGGDVGRHVAITMRSILQTLGGELPEKLDEIPETERATWLSERYVEGTHSFETDDQAKQEVTLLNKRIYRLQNDKDHESAFARIYWTTRQWSYDYFDQFYERIGTKFEKYYPESETTPTGMAKAEALKAEGVLVESDGAVVFRGEEHGLHTRVFITSEGLPTYETKDLGLILRKWEDYHFNQSVVITGNDIVEYMKVVLKVVEHFQPELATNTAHISHGIVKLAGGVKMSSRKGNILRAVDVLTAADAANEKATGKKDDQVVLGAVKYAFLKQRTGGDIIYDPEESVSLQGNSGPYLQYAHARARSILKKGNPTYERAEFETDERSLIRKISEYPEIVENAVNELMPHHICTYLYELSQNFNRFYENNRVIGDPRENIRLNLVQAYAETLKKGLTLLGISAPETM